MSHANKVGGRSVLVPLAARVLSVLIIVAAVVVSLWAWAGLRHSPRTDDAFARANDVGIAPKVSGYIVNLAVRDNQAVRQGDLLFEIDSRDYEAHLRQAESHLASLEARIALADTHTEELRLAASAASAEVQRVEAALKQAQDTLARIEPLLANGFVTEEAVDQARTAVRTSEAALESATQRAAQAAIALSEAEVLRAEQPGAVAAVDLARMHLEDCRVVAPFDGRVISLNISEGAFARAGVEVFTLLDTRTWYVLANFREGELPYLREGNDVDVYLMARPDVRFRGVIEGIGWAVHPEDGLVVGGVPVVKRELNWVHIAQRFPVRIRVENPDPELFRMGVSAYVRARRQ